jgi:hypothetical protein
LSSVIFDAMLGQTSLPESNSGTDNHSRQRKYLDDKFLLFASLVFLAFGIVLLCRTWWNVCFNLTPDSNVAVYVTLVLLSACLIWIGMVLIGL